MLDEKKFCFLLLNKLFDAVWTFSIENGPHGPQGLIHYPVAHYPYIFCYVSQIYLLHYPYITVPISIYSDTFLYRYPYNNIIIIVSVSQIVHYIWSCNSYEKYLPVIYVGYDRCSHYFLSSYWLSTLYSLRCCEACWSVLVYVGYAECLHHL